MIFDIDKALTITPEMKRFFDAGANIKSNNNNNTIMKHLQYLQLAI